MKPANAEYFLAARSVPARARNRPSNLAETPHPTPASLGVETA